MFGNGVSSIIEDDFGRLYGCQDAARYFLGERDSLDASYAIGELSQIQSTVYTLATDFGTQEVNAGTGALS